MYLVMVGLIFRPLSTFSLCPFRFSDRLNLSVLRKRIAIWLNLDPLPQLGRLIGIGFLLLFSQKLILSKLVSTHYYALRTGRSSERFILEKALNKICLETIQTNTTLRYKTKIGLCKS